MRAPLALRASLRQSGRENHFICLPGTCIRFAQLGSCGVPGYFQSRLTALAYRIFRELRRGCGYGWAAVVSFGSAEISVIRAISGMVYGLADC